MKRVHVTITADTTRLEAALRGLNESLERWGYFARRSGRRHWRARLTPGERHIDRMCREVAGKPDAALRLFVAAGCVAPVLDGESS